MAYIEAAVVVYLRELYYPEGFSFPLKLIPDRLLFIELLREAATIVMLAIIAVLTGRKPWERFGWFIIAFGIWDIFYYIWLRATICWPAGLLDWDILFLVPLPWIGPVIAPILISLVMIGAGLSITRLYDGGRTFSPPRSSWILAVAATVIILYSFMRDTGATLNQHKPQPYYFSLLIIGLAFYIIALILARKK